MSAGGTSQGANWLQLTGVVENATVLAITGENGYAEPAKTLTGDFPQGVAKKCAK